MPRFFIMYKNDIQCGRNKGNRMDIYQIWTTYNKKWSRYEILVFSIVLLLTVIVLTGCVCRNKINLIPAVAVVIMVIFLGIVFGSTVFTRTSTVRQYELMPFWSWKVIWKYRDWTLLKENLLNCILLFPAGVLLPIIANHKVKWYWALLFGVLVSAVIEISQLIFMCGLFEWDDMIHNGLGCMMGSAIFNFLKFSYSKR